MNACVDRHRLLQTNQFAVSEVYKAIPTLMGAPTEVPGIFVKYFIEPISVQVKEEPRDLVAVLIRLVGIVGGVWVTFGLVYRILVKFGVAGS